MRNVMSVLTIIERQVCVCVSERERVKHGSWLTQWALGSPVTMFN